MAYNVNDVKPRFGFAVWKNNSDDISFADNTSYNPSDDANKANWEYIGGFTKISGINQETNVIEFRTGDDFNTKKLPGFNLSPEFTMERAATDDTKLKNWYDRVFSSSAGGGTSDFRADLLIAIIGRDLFVYKQLFVDNAWISKYDLGDLDAQSEEAATETITVQHDGYNIQPLKKGGELEPYKFIAPL